MDHLAAMAMSNPLHRSINIHKDTVHRRLNRRMVKMAMHKRGISKEAMLKQVNMITVNIHKITSKCDIYRGKYVVSTPFLNVQCDYQ